MVDLVFRARRYAELMHKNQTRKYTGEPYTNHLKEVAELVESINGSEEMIAAAWLHDTVEDTAATHEDIKNAFGSEVSMLVWMLTDISKPEDGNRELRKTKDRLHIKHHANNNAKSIKLADVISNTKSIFEHDIKFARVYLVEQQKLLKVLFNGGNPTLFLEANSLVNSLLSKLKEMDNV